MTKLLAIGHFLFGHQRSPSSRAGSSELLSLDTDIRDMRNVDIAPLQNLLN
jgi:hypothetical protein